MPTPLESGRQTPKIKPLNDRKKQLSQNAIENRRRLKNRFFLVSDRLFAHLFPHGVVIHGKTAIDRRTKAVISSS